jgi:ketosteroid isomerase-like protein
MADLQANKAIVMQFFECLSAADADALMDLYTDDVEVWTAGDLPLSGIHPRSELRGLIEGVSGAFPEGWHFTPKTLTAEEDRVAVQAEGTGKHVSGRVYQQKYHFLFWLRDGKIARFDEYFDTKHASEILFGAPAPSFEIPGS